MISNDAKVSVIMPNFNCAAYLDQSITSVLKQTHKNFELVIVDDGSTDNSLDIVAKYVDSDPRIVVFSQENAGVAAARNLGIERSNGEFIAFLDADDVWHASKLERQLASLQHNRGFDISFSSFSFWHPDSEGCYIDPDSIFTELDGVPDYDRAFCGDIYHQLLRDVYVWTGTVVLKRSVLDSVGLFDSSLLVGEDYDLWLRLSLNYEFIKVDETLALYRQVPQSITRKVHEQNYSAIVLEKFISLHGLAGPSGKSISQKEGQEILFDRWFRYGYQCFWSRRPDLAAKAFSHALSIKLCWKVLIYRVLSLKYVYSPFIFLTKRDVSIG